MQLNNTLNILWHCPSLGLEWKLTFFSPVTTAWVRVKSLQLCPTIATPWTVAHQAPLLIGFSSEEHWSGFPFPSQGYLSDSGIKPVTLRSPALAAGFCITSVTWKATWEAVTTADFSNFAGILEKRRYEKWKTAEMNEFYMIRGFPGISACKESTCNARDTSSILGSGRSPGEGIGYPLQYSWASLVTQMVKNSPAMWDTWVLSLGWEDPLEEGMATHSSILPGESPWTEEPGAHGVTKSQTQLSD